MKMTDKMRIKFTNIVWHASKDKLPDRCELDIPCKFFCVPIEGTDRCRVLGTSQDLHDIFIAYLFDEFGECPKDFTFQMQYDF